MYTHQNTFLHSPIQEREFVWFGNYADGTHISEFAFDTHKENSFYTIQKSNLLNFGLVGHGYYFHYTTHDGIFHLGDKHIEIVYRTNEGELFQFNKQNVLYNDIITYKDAECTFSGLRTQNKLPVNIYQYNFGYKQKFTINGINFFLKSICTIPLNQPAYMNIHLVADKDLNGDLYIIKNGTLAHKYQAPLKANQSGELNWVVR